MKIGLIGLGKMGINIGKQLIDRNHQAIGYDVNQAAVDELISYGAEGTTNIKELISLLDTPRILWVMVPHDVVDAVLSDVAPLLNEGDIIIEAGNSHYKESIRRYNQMKEAGLHYLDAGTSGGMEERVTGLVIWLEETRKHGVSRSRCFGILLLKMDIYMPEKRAAATF